jgi:uncharacterized protein (UPF0333 family)
LSSGGQVVIEYVLLLLITVSIAALVISRFASRDAANPGFLVLKWCNIQKTIREDNPGDRSRPNATKDAPGCP